MFPIALANPRLELHNAAGALIGSNDDWQHTIIGGVITTDKSAIFRTAATLRRIHSNRRSLQICQPGNYTAIVRGVNNMTGVALVEVYDLSNNGSFNSRQYQHSQLCADW